MLNFDFYKRVCGVLFLLCGLIFSGGLNPEVANAQQSAVVGGGCAVISVPSGNFNSNPTGVQVGYTNASHCFDFEPILEFDFSTQPYTEINTNSPVLAEFSGWKNVDVQNFQLIELPFTFFNTFNGCKLYSGRTNDNPLENQGVIDFDNFNPGGSYRTCMELINSSPTVNNYKINGWAWNTNLGWFSMEGVDDGSGNIRNVGLNTGSVPFQSAMRVQDNGPTNKGELYGYWWNDVAGWVKLNCRADTALNPSDVNNCAVNGGANYGVYIESFSATTGRALLAGYAWSDTFGYIDFRGVEVIVPGFNLASYTPRVTYVKDTTSSNSLIRANGRDGYRVEVKMFSGSVDRTELFADANLGNGFCMVFEDNRDLDEIAQTKVSNQAGGTPVYNCSGGAVTLQDNLQLNNMSWDSGARDVFANGATDRFVYDPVKKVFVSNQVVVSRIPSKNGGITLKEIQLRNGITGASRVVSSVNLTGTLEYEVPYDLKFVGGAITNQSQCKEGGLILDFENPMPASMCGEYFNPNNRLGALSVDVVGSPKVNPSYQSKFSSLQAVFNNNNKTLRSSGSGYGAVNLEVSLVLAQGVSASEIEPLASVLELRVPSSVSYVLGGGYSVRRLGPDLIDDSKNIFEVNVQGGLVDRSFDSVAFSSGSKDSLGVARGVEVKQNVYQSLRNILSLEPGKCANLSLAKVDRSSIAEKILPGCGRVSSAAGKEVIYVSTSSSADAYLTFSELEKMLQDSESRSPDGGAPVVVLNGFDLVIDKNIIPASLRVFMNGEDSFGLIKQSDLKGLPAFVVLRSEVTGQGGEVIVSAEDVTDVAAYIYADGRMLSASNANLARQAAAGNAEVVLNRSLMDEIQLFNQFSFAGVLYSTNCIGCSSASPALRADGSVSESRVLSLMEDLNAFRYTPLKFGVKSVTVSTDLGFDFDLDGVNDVVEQNFSCYVPCPQIGNDAWEPSINNSMPQCNLIGQSLDLSKACFDRGLFEGAAVNRLSEFEEWLASSRQGSKTPWFQFSWLESDPSLGFDTLRSVNLRPLPVYTGMPVFGSL